MKTDLNSWATALELVARLHHRSVSADTVRDVFAWSQGSTLEEHLRRATQRLGLSSEFLVRNIEDTPAFVLPIIAELRDGGVVIVMAIGAGSISCVSPAGGSSLEWEVSRAEAVSVFTGRQLLLAPATAVHDSRLGSYLSAHTPSWFWGLIFADKRRHAEIAVASFLANLLALASSLFAMQVWDRVVPSQSIPTLWVLASGVTLAVLFEFVLRVSRVKVADTLGKKVDLTISSMFFARALDIRNDARPKSTGAFIAQLRETESIRETVASTTLTAAVDIPFAVTFLFVIWAMAGPLIWAVTLAIPLIVIPGLLLQIPLARLSGKAAREGALRHAILVESIEGIEDIKSLQAEARFHRQWDRFSFESSNVGLEQKQYVTTYTYWISAVQQVCYVAVIVLGVYMVLAGELTTGGVIGASMLTGRALSPFVQFAQIFTKWQSAKTARSALNELLNKPLDHDPQVEKLRCPIVLGSYALERVTYCYSPDEPAVLSIASLKISSGEKVALVGRNGSGKSTLLKILGTSLVPSTGTVLVDEAIMGQVDIGDIRRNVSLLTQDSRLFHGTLMENLKMGAPLSSDEALSRVLAISGVSNVLKSLPKGLETLIYEGGGGLSGGQRQSILLARTLLRDTPVVLLDEPTSAMDETAERDFVARLRPWAASRTLIISTHRPSILDLVDRIIVMDRGRIVVDGQRDEVLRQLDSRPKSGGKVSSMHKMASVHQREGGQE